MALIEALYLIDNNDYKIAVRGQLTDWEDVQRRVDLCAIWVNALDTLSSADAARIDFQMGQLDLELLFGQQGCDTGIDSGDTVDG